MREQAKHTSVAPRDRIQRLLAFGQRLINNPSVSDFVTIINFFFFFQVISYECLMPRRPLKLKPNQLENSW